MRIRSLIRRDIDNTPEADMARRGINRLGNTCRRAITQAVVGRAQVRATFDNLARNPELRLSGIVTFGWRDDARIDCRATAGLDHFVGVARHKNQSQVHSHTLPAMSYKPKPFGGKDPIGEVPW